MAKRIIAGDSGKFNTKAVVKTKEGKIERVMFRTKMDETDESKTVYENTFAVNFKGQRYLLGDKAETVDYDTSKAKELHKIALFTAIAQLVNDNDTITLFAGCPLNIFKNIEARKKYEEYLRQDKKVTIEVNEQKKTFIIEEVIACPESSGIIFKEPHLGDKVVVVVDIGGLNTNACVYDGGDPILSTAFTLNEGANVLTNNIRLKLNEKLGLNIQDFQMQQILRDGFVKPHIGESKEIIQSMLQEHIDTIITELKKKNYDINTLDFVFVGGGSLLLQKQILQFIPDAVISKNAVWDNVEGFLVLGDEE